MSKTYIFNDPIHGTMELDAVLVKIIDTPEFQRLRNIKQLGAAYYVYPGATHNRFEHCIGVSYIAGQVLDKLAQQEDIKISVIDKLCVQISGLLHDIGHGPFSHLFDDAFIQQSPDSKHWSHEMQSCRIFDHILDNNNEVAQALKDAGITATDILFIKELVNPNDYKNSNHGGWPFEGRTQESSFLYEIVSNERTGIDVDKFDYLLRDCFHLGVNCIFDWRRLVHMMKVIERDGQRVIAIRDKEKDNVFNMFYLRMHLRRIAYQHITGTAVQLMIGDIFKMCDNVLFPDMLLSETINHIPKYLTLTDSILETISNMNVISNSQPNNLRKAQQLIHRIHTRRLYTLLAETPPSTSDFKNKETVLNEIVGEDEHLREHIILDDLTLNFGKWGPTGDPLQRVAFYDKHGHVVPEKLYNQSSLFVPSSWCQKQLRMYCKSEDEVTLDICRKKCESWIARKRL